MARKKPTKFQVILATRIIPRLRMANYWLIAQFAMGALWLLRRMPPDTALDFAASFARRIGPWVGRHRTAVSNLTKAYPEKTPEEIEAIALDMWSNMAKLAAEYIFLDTLFDYDPNAKEHGRVTVVGVEHFLRMAADKKPHIIFTGHLGNFELLPIAGEMFGMKVAALFRPPNNPYIAKYILSTRRSSLSNLVASRSGAAFTLSAELEKGGNIGVLVDQKFINGMPTTFFGRPCETNPVAPMLARRFDCDVYPTRCIRLPGNRYRLEIEDRLELARNDLGDIDIPAATQQLNDVVERWVREDPGQWMWFHKRWSVGRIRRPKRQIAKS